MPKPMQICPKESEEMPVWDMNLDFFRKQLFMQHHFTIYSSVDTINFFYILPYIYLCIFHVDSPKLDIHKRLLT